MTTARKFGADSDGHGRHPILTDARGVTDHQDGWRSSWESLVNLNLETCISSLAGPGGAALPRRRPPRGATCRHRRVQDGARGRSEPAHRTGVGSLRPRRLRPSPHPTGAINGRKLPDDDHGVWMGTHKLATGNRQRPTDGPGRCVHCHPRRPPVTPLSTQKVPRTLGAGISARPTGGPGGASMTTSGRHVGARVVRIWPQVLETGNRCWLTRRTRRCAHGHPGVPQVAPPPTQKVSSWTPAQYPSLRPAGQQGSPTHSRRPGLQSPESESVSAVR